MRCWCCNSLQHAYCSSLCLPAPARETKDSLQHFCFLLQHTFALRIYYAHFIGSICVSHCVTNVGCYTLFYKKSSCMSFSKGIFIMMKFLRNLVSPSYKFDCELIRWKFTGGWAWVFSLWFSRPYGKIGMILLVAFPFWMYDCGQLSIFLYCKGLNYHMEWKRERMLSIVEILPTLANTQFFL